MPGHHKWVGKSSVKILDSVLAPFPPYASEARNQATETGGEFDAITRGWARMATQVPWNSDSIAFRSHQPPPTALARKQAIQPCSRQCVGRIAVQAQWVAGKPAVLRPRHKDNQRSNANSNCRAPKANDRWHRTASASAAPCESTPSNKSKTPSQTRHGHMLSPLAIDASSPYRKNCVHGQSLVTDLNSGLAQNSVENPASGISRALRSGLRSMIVRARVKGKHRCAKNFAAMILPW